MSGALKLKGKTVGDGSEIPNALCLTNPCPVDVRTQIKNTIIYSLQL